MKKAILIVSFGTSHRDAREHSLDCIVKDIQTMAENVMEAGADNPGYKESLPETVGIYQAYTSGMILNVLAREGVSIPTVEQAAEQILSDGVKELVVVPTHMIPGMEYHKMLNALEPYRSGLDKLAVTTTVLENQRDCEALVPVLQDICGFEPGIEYILMGHGTEADANIRYTQMNEAFNRAGLSNVRIASVEAKPDMDDALERLNQIKDRRNIEKVIVQPFMVVAGDHAKNDMAGEEESYVTRLREAGFTVEPVIKGLGEYSQFRSLYVEKAKKMLCI